MDDLIERLRADAEMIHNNGITRKLRRHRVAALLREAAAALEACVEALRVEVAPQRTRADAMAGEAIKHEARAEALRAEVDRLNRILGRIVACDGDSTLVIRMGADAFAAAREYLLRDQEEGK